MQSQIQQSLFTVSMQRASVTPRMQIGSQESRAFTRTSSVSSINMRAKNDSFVVPSSQSNASVSVSRPADSQRYNFKASRATTTMTMGTTSSTPRMPTIGSKSTVRSNQNLGQTSRSKVVMHAMSKPSDRVNFPNSEAQKGWARSSVIMSATEGEESIEIEAVDVVDTPVETEASDISVDEPVVTAVSGEDEQVPVVVPEELKTDESAGNKESYTLYYFDAKGRAEPMRILLAHAGVDYTDKRLERKEWGNMKQNVPNKKVPILEVDDGMNQTKLGQSGAILRFLGKKHGYYPEDPLAAHKCDYLIDCFNDKFIGVALNSALPQKLIDIDSPFNQLNKAIPDLIEFLEPYLGTDTYLCGNDLTIADFVIGGFYVNSILEGKEQTVQDKWVDLLNKYPNFKTYGENFKEANLEYLSQRKQTKM